MAVQIIRSVVTLVDGTAHDVRVENGIVNDGHKHVDERVRDPYEVAAGEALLQFADGDMADLRERIVPIAEDSLCLRGSGGGEKVCAALQDI